MIVAKPTKNSRKVFPYRILGKDQYLHMGERKITDKGEEINIEYLDIVAPMLYLDSVENTDIREMIRILMFHISQRFTPEEVKEILTTGVSNKFTGGSFATIGDSEEENRYANLIHSFLTENNIHSFLVGDQALYSSKDDFEKYLLGLKRENIPKQDIPVSEELDKNKISSTENNTVKQPEERNKENNILIQIQKTKNQISQIELSEISKAFMLSIIQSGEIGILTKDNVGNYVCAMLHGIGLVLPHITEDETKEIEKEIRIFIDKRLEVIMQKHIAYFERPEESEKVENSDEK